MERRRPSRGWCFILLLLAGAARGAEPTVVLISLDGTTPDEISRAELPTFAALAARGATAERLIPAFPTNTFPNHVTLVTGVVPDRHGIVNNVFVDPERGTYRYDPDPTWIEVEPIWSLAARHGIVSASFHWVGSEGPWRTGFGPRHWRPFDGSVSELEKVKRILAWLDEKAPTERPRLITSWFRGADHAGHLYGPGSRRVTQVLRRQDEAVARLLRGIEARGLLSTTTLLLVSDHGMSRVERVVDLQHALREDPLRARVLGGGGFAMVTLEDPRGESERVLQIAKNLGLEAYRRCDAPADLRVHHLRFGDVVVLAPVGTAITRRDSRSDLAHRLVGSLFARFASGAARLRGAHGYRPEVPSMGGLFVAIGRGVPPGLRIPSVRAVDVAPTTLALLDVPVPSWMEGRPLTEIVRSLSGSESESVPKAEEPE